MRIVLFRVVRFTICPFIQHLCLFPDEFHEFDRYYKRERKGKNDVEKNDTEGN